MPHAGTKWCVITKTDTPLIEDILSDVLSRDDLKADHIHPNAAGCRKLAQGLQAEPRALGFLRSE